MTSVMYFAYNLIVRFLPETRCFGLKRVLLRMAGAEIGRDARIGSSVFIYGTGRLVIGDHVWIGAKSFIQLSADAKVEIGDNVDIAPCVRIITGSHEIGLGGSHMAGPGYSSSVRVGNGCWVGASSVLLPGVNLPDMTVVAAGSVVTRSFANGGCLLAGVPAMVKKRYL